MTTLALDWAQMDQASAPDFHALYAAGFRVVIFRRSQCYYDRANRAFRLAHDPTFERCAAAARTAGLVVGAYMFPSFTKGAPSPAEQRANFDVAGGELIPGVDLPPFLDLEFSGNGIADTGHTQAEVAELLRQHVVEMKRAYGACGLYSSHVQLCDTNGLGNAAAGLQELADVMFWQKTPYRLRAGQAQDTQPRDPHLGHVATDPNDYFRTPMPFEKDGGWVIGQFQGDARGLPGGLRQADVDDVHVIARGYVGPEVVMVRRRLGLAVDSNVFDDAVNEAVRGLQTKRGLDVDGVIGAKTWAAIAWTAA